MRHELTWWKRLTVHCSPVTAVAACGCVCLVAVCLSRASHTHVRELDRDPDDPPPPPLSFCILLARAIPFPPASAGPLLERFFFLFGSPAFFRVTMGSPANPDQLKPNQLRPVRRRERRTQPHFPVPVMQSVCLPSRRVAALFKQHSLVST